MNNDDFELDIKGLDDIDDFDQDSDGEISGLEDPKPNERSAIADVASGVVEGAVDEISDINTIRNAVAKSFPSEYSAQVGAVSDEIGSMRDELRDSVAKLRPQLNQIKTTMRRIVPESKKGMVDKIAEKFGLGDDEQGSGPSDKEIRDQGIKSELDSLFKATQEAETIKQQRIDKKEQLRDVVSHSRHVTNIDALVRIGDELARQTAYNDTIDSKYKRKMLELKLKGYYLQKKTYEMLSEQGTIAKTQQAAIVKNTALPDFIKLRRSERFVEMFGSRGIGDVVDTMYGSSGNILANGVKNVKKKLMQKMQESEGVLDTVSAGLEQQEQMKEMQESYAEMGMQVDSKAKSIASVAAGIAAQYGLSKLSKKAKEKLVANAESKFGNKVLDGANKAKIVNRYVESELRKFSQSGDDEETWLKKMSRRAAGQARGMLYTSGESEFELFKDTQDINEARLFDGNAHRALVKKIPWLLEEQVRILESIKDGKEATRLTYDLKTGEYSREDVVMDRLRNNLATASGSERFKDSVDRAYEAIIGSSTLSPKAEAALKHIIAKNPGVSSKDISKGLFSKDDLLGKRMRNLIKDPEVYAELSDVLGKELSGSGHERDGDIIDALGDVSSSLGMSTGLIDQLHRQGMTPQLKKLGIISGSEGSGYKINTSAIEDLMISRSFGEGVAASTNLPSPDSVEGRLTPVSRGSTSLSSTGGGEYLSSIHALLEQMSESITSSRPRDEDRVISAKVDDNYEPITSRLDLLMNSVDRLSEEGISLIMESGGGGSGGVEAKPRGRVRRAWDLAGYVKDEVFSAFDKVKVGEKPSSFIHGKGRSALSGIQKIIGATTSTMGDVAGNIREKMSASVRDLSPKAFGMAFGAIGMGIAGAKKLTKYIKDRPIDLYTVGPDGKRRMALSATLMKNFGYVDVNTGKIIQKMSDITGPIRENLPDGNIVLGIDDLRNGLTDIRGKDYRSLFGKMTGRLRSVRKGAMERGRRVISGTLSAAKRLGILGAVAGSAGAGKLKSLISKTPSIQDVLKDSRAEKKLNSILSSAQELGTDAVARLSAVSGLAVVDSNKRQSTLLLNILRLLDKRLPKRSRAFNDSDGDGIRSGSWKELLSKQKDRSSKLGRDLLAKFPGSKAMGRKEAAAGSGLLGMFADLASTAISGVTTVVEAAVAYFAGKKLLGGFSEDGVGGSNRKDRKRGKKRRGGRLKGKLGRLLGGAASLLGVDGLLDIFGTSDDDDSSSYNDAPSDKKSSRKTKPKSKLAKLGKSVGRGAWWLAKNAAKTAVSFGVRAIGTTAAAMATGLSAPVVAGAAAAAAVGYGGYKAYEYFTRDNVGPLTEIRFMQYGFNAIHKDHFHRLIGLEERLLKNAVVWKGDRPTINVRTIDMDYIYETFGFRPSDAEANNNFKNWFNVRFKPFFLTHLVVIKELGIKEGLKDIDKIQGELREKYIAKIRFDNGPYNVVTSPIPGLTSLPSNFMAVKNMLDIAMMASTGKVEKDAVAKNKVDRLKVQIEEEQVVQPRSKPSAPVNYKDFIGPKRPKTMQGKPYQSAYAEPAGNVGADSPKGQAYGGRPIVRMPDSIKGGVPSAMATGPRATGENGADYVVLSSKIKDSHVKGMHPKMWQAFLAMAQEYGELTGKKIHVNSLYRSMAEQAAGYKRDPTTWGKPGGSLHNYGLAIDADTVDLDALDKMGLMKKYGFTRPVGGETWHMESSGVTVNRASARNNPELAGRLIDSSFGRGGGGYGTVVRTKSERQRRGNRYRDKALARKIYEAAGGTPIDNNSKRSTVIPAPQELASDVGGSSATGTYKNATKSAAINPSGRKAFSSSAGQVPRQTFQTTSVGVDYQAEPDPSALNELNKMGRDQGSGRGYILNILEKAAKAVGIDPKMYQVFAAKESSLNPRAKAKTSSAKGLLQFLDGTWRWAVKKWGKKWGVSLRDSPYDPKKAAIMGAVYLKNNLETIKNVKPNSNAVDAYLTHFLGPGGARSFLRNLRNNPNRIAYYDSPKRARANRPTFSKNGRWLSYKDIYSVLTKNLKRTASRFKIPYSVSGSTVLAGSTTNPSESGLGELSNSLSGDVGPAGPEGASAYVADGHRRAPGGTMANMATSSYAIQQHDQEPAIHAPQPPSELLQRSAPSQSRFDTEVHETQKQQLSTQMAILDLLRTYVTRSSSEKKNVGVSEVLPNRNNAVGSEVSKSKPAKPAPIFKSAPAEVVKNKASDKR